MIDIAHGFSFYFIPKAVCFVHIDNLTEELKEY